MKVVSEASALGPSLPNPGARPSAEMTKTKAETILTEATVTGDSSAELARAGLSVATSSLNKGQGSLPCPWPGSPSPWGLQNLPEKPHSPIFFLVLWGRLAGLLHQEAPGPAHPSPSAGRAWVTESCTAADHGPPPAPRLDGALLGQGRDTFVSGLRRSECWGPASPHPPGRLPQARLP